MSRFLDDIKKFVDSQPFDIIRISEYRGGKIETLEYKEENPCQNVYSVAKTFTMTAIGMLWDRGLVSLDSRIADLFKEEFPAEADSRWQTATVRHALTHSLGLPGGFLDIDTHHLSEFGKDFLDYTFRYPLEYTPGESSAYSDGAYYILARIVEKISGMTLDNFMWENLLTKFGCREMAWSHCPMGHVIGATGLYIGSEDMAKLGAVYLNKGMYEGERILSEKWVETAVSEEFALDWDETRTVYSKGGMCGQRLIIDPVSRRVAALESFGADSNKILEFTRDYKD